MPRTAIFCLLASVLLWSSGCSPSAETGETPPEPVFATRVVATGLDYPWEVAWGPDDRLWVTERVGKRITRVNPTDGTRTVAVEVEGVYQAVGQDGLLGMALHPELLAGTGNDHVYVGYTYDADPGPAEFPRNAIRRYTYDEATETLGEPAEVTRRAAGSQRPPRRPARIRTG